jgi:hypothetical protein
MWWSIYDFKGNLCKRADKCAISAFKKQRGGEELDVLLWARTTEGFNG